ncbi:MAG: hypothetical protein ACPGXK_02590 [Phycisphaerae bacterium]
MMKNFDSNRRVACVARVVFSIVMVALVVAPGSAIRVEAQLPDQKNKRPEEKTKSRRELPPLRPKRQVTDEPTTDGDQNSKGTRGEDKTDKARNEESEAERRLRKRLVDQAVKGREENVMDRIMDLMKESAQRIDLAFDPGKETQRYQREIIEQLDAAIDEAASRTRRSNNQSGAKGEKRKMKQPPKKQAGKKKGKQTSDGDGREGKTNPGTVKQGDGSKSELEFDARLGWGALPPRDRDEVIQGFGEEYLEAYRRWIERYYRALQEAGE